MFENSILMWLSRVNGLGPKKIDLLLDYFKNPIDIYNASKNDFYAVKGITRKNIEHIISSKSDNDIEKYITQLKNLNINYISKLDKHYPTLLKKIYDPPIGIYYKGTLPKDDVLKIGVIGSRKSSEYGLQVCKNISGNLAKNKILIVSGMARGIDSQAHKAALSVDEPTIAILGSGVDICYPPENRLLRDKILEKGCLISEYPPGTTPYAKNFPARNRIISGICNGILVIEAASKSGTFITVEQALEQGRDVFAIPGNVTRDLSEGTNDLIKDGAIMVTSYKDILNELKTADRIKEVKKDVSSCLAQSDKLVYDCISFDPLEYEKILDEITTLDIEDITYILTSLELKGYIKRLNGNRYVRMN